MNVSDQFAMSRAEKEHFHSVLRRAVERAERRKDTELAEKLAREIAALDLELRFG